MEGGGKFLVRGNAVKTYESGVMRRVVVIDDRVKKVVGAHDAEGYQAALKLLGDGAARDIRIVMAQSNVRCTGRLE
jgi:uncharacterized protein (DUF1330 family)